MRQPHAKKCAQVIGAEVVIFIGFHVGDQSGFFHRRSVGAGEFLGCDGGMADSRVLAERCLDLGELDAKTTDANAAVPPSCPFDVAIRQISAELPGAV